RPFSPQGDGPQLSSSTPQANLDRVRGRPDRPRRRAHNPPSRAATTAQFPPRRTTLKEAAGRAMTQPTLLEAALQRAAAVSNLIQGEALGVADACVVLAEAAAPLSPESARVAVAEGMASGLLVVPHAVDNVILLTQTCDLQYTTPEEHRCLVA